MTKLRLIEQVAVQTRMTHAEVTTFIETIFARMADALAKATRLSSAGSAASVFGGGVRTRAMWSRLVKQWT